MARMAFTVLLLFGTGCAPGNGPTAESPSPSPTASPTPTVDAAAEAAQELHAECEAALGDFLEALQEIDSRLNVGLVFQDYTNRVGDAQVEYDQVPFDSLALPCVTGVGIPAEAALNHYIRADNQWNNCIGDFNCDTDGIEPELQKKWSKATSAIESAREGLEDLATP